MERSRQLRRSHGFGLSLASFLLFELFEQRNVCLVFLFFHRAESWGIVVVVGGIGVGFGVVCGGDRLFGRGSNV